MILYDADRSGSPEMFLLGIVVLLGIGFTVYILDRVILS